MNSILDKGMVQNFGYPGSESKEINMFIPLKVISRSGGSEHEEQTHTLMISEKGALFLGGGDYAAGMEIMVCVEGHVRNVVDGARMMFCCPAEITSIGEFHSPTQGEEKYRAVAISFKDKFSLKFKDQIEEIGSTGSPVFFADRSLYRLPL